MRPTDLLVVLYIFCCQLPKIHCPIGSTRIPPWKSPCEPIHVTTMFAWQGKIQTKVSKIGIGYSTGSTDCLLVCTIHLFASNRIPPPDVNTGFACYQMSVDMLYRYHDVIRFAWRPSWDRQQGASDFRWCSLWEWLRSQCTCQSDKIL